MAKHSDDAFFFQTPLSVADIARISQCRGEHNRLGFAYQLIFVQLLNRFPAQDPFEIEVRILDWAAVQSEIASEGIELYGNRQKTVSEHQENIRQYLGLRSFSDAFSEINEFLFREACQLEQTAALSASLRDFLKKNHILEPTEYTLQRTVQTQREAARVSVYEKIASALSDESRQRLGQLLETNDAP